MANLDTLRARVAQLEQAIARGEQESAEATGLLATEQDENVIVKLWGRITARKNSGKALAEQLTVAREEVIAAEKAEAMVKYEEARKAYAASVVELKKEAAKLMVKAEAAAAAFDVVVKTQYAAGEKYLGSTLAAKWGADPYVLINEALGLQVRGSWSDGLQCTNPKYGRVEGYPDLLNTRWE
jgi:hypothetical protein